MAISSFLVLSLALLAHARPKHAFEPEDVGNKITLPVISSSHSSARGVAVDDNFSRRSAGDEEDKPFHILPFPSKRDVESSEEDDKPFHILPFPYAGKRTILEDDDGAAGAITLPVPRPSKRDAEDQEDKPFHILPFNDKRKLPVEDGPLRTITLPIIHAHRGLLDKRAVEVQVENRSDVSYYAQRKKPTLPNLMI